MIFLTFIMLPDFPNYVTYSRYSKYDKLAVCGTNLTRIPNSGPAFATHATIIIQLIRCHKMAAVNNKYQPNKKLL